MPTKRQKLLSAILMMTLRRETAYLEIYEEL